MKRLDAFGFSPQAISPSCPPPKRARDEISTAHESSSSSLATAQSQDLPPQVRPPQRSDLGTYSHGRLRNLNNEERLWLYNNAFRPDPKYAFPSKEEYGKKRSFQYSWIRQFSWLCYSVSQNGGFCCTCILFAKNFLSLGQLVTSPMVNFTRAKVTLSEHDKQSSHRMACQDAMEFLSQMENGKPSVRQLLENELGTSIAKNRAILKSILKVIIFCGKQNISLRGHCEQIGSHSNHGNFLALVDFCLDAGDSILADHFKTCGRNAHTLHHKCKMT